MLFLIKLIQFSILIPVLIGMLSCYDDQLDYDAKYETLQQARVINGTTFEAGTGLYYFKEKLTTVTLAKEQHLFDQNVVGKMLVQKFPSGTKLEYGMGLFPSIVLAQPYTLYEITIPEKSQLGISVSRVTLDGNESEHIHFVIWTHIPFEINGTHYPAGTSIEIHSKDKVYVYIPPKMKREKI